MMKKLLGIAVLVGLASVANAAPIQCSTVSTFQALLASNGNAEPGCQDQDKIYSNWSGTLPGSTAVGISFVIGSTAEQHLVSFGDLAPGTYNLSYVISIDPTPATLHRWITQVLIDEDAIPGSGSVSKSIYAWNGAQGALIDTIVSSNGVPDFTALIHEKALFINETFTITTSAYQSATNVFVQQLDEQIIPEPATYAMIGGGLIGLVLLNRRKFRMPQ